ncbi:MAG TPA: hypothetical protein VK858_21225 [Longimicrobiales bacterium]|nr:hypothetical protein [Longimicrobiales bacterium]
MLGLAACAPAPSGVPTPVPEDELPALEARLAASPQSEELQLSATASLLAADRCADAVAVANRVPATPEDAWPVLTRGYCLEIQGAWDEARSVYEDYLRRFDRGGGIPSVRGRLEWVRERSADERARRLVAQGPSGTPDPSLVAVLPMETRGDPGLAYVGLGLTALVRSDLALVDGLDVADPHDLDALLAELERTGSPVPDSLLPAELGRLAGAGRMARGVADLDERTEARLDAALRLPGGDEVTAGQQAGDLAELPALQKRLTFAMIRRLGFTITVAERDRIANNGTRDSDALLAYARGLDLRARGQEDQAALWFARATGFDPGFREARVALETVVGEEVAERTSARTLFASVPTARTRVQQRLQAARTGPADPMRLAMISGTGDVASTQGEQIMGPVGRVGQEGAVGSITALEPPPLLALTQLQGVIRVIVVIPGGV